MLIWLSRRWPTRFGVLHGGGPVQGRVVGAVARDLAGAGRYLVGAAPLARAASSLTAGAGYRAPAPPPQPRRQPRAPNPEP